MPVLEQPQLPPADAPWSHAAAESCVTPDNAWRWTWKLSGAAGPAPPPPLPSTPEDLSSWRWRVPPVLPPGGDCQDGGGALCLLQRVQQAVEVEQAGPWAGRRVRFYRRVSYGSATARIARPLNNGRFYWELHLGDRMYGTAIMVGVGTKAVRGSTATFKNLLGEDEHGWGLSHKGVVWHGGLWSPYSDPFPQNEATTIGVLFDGVAGTLSFFKDNQWLGIAFTGLDKVTQPLYPMVASTARNTKMTLLSARRELGSLAERCRATVLRSLANPPRDVARLPLPASVRAYVQDGVVSAVSLPATNPAHWLLI